MTESRAPEVVAVGLISFILAFIFTSLRAYVRLRIGKNWAADDWLICAALACLCAYVVLGLFGIKNGIGQHVKAILAENPENLPRALMYWWLCELIYVACTLFSRTSVALLLLRICERKLHIIIIYTTMTVSIIYSVFYFFLLIFQCNPPSYFWTQYLGASGDCLNPAMIADATYINIAVAATADWVLGLLPIWLIWNLKLDIRTKISTAVVLSLGLIAGIAAVVRAPEVMILDVTDDFLWHMVKISNLSSAEAGLLIIAAGACTLRPLLRKYLDFSIPTGKANPQPDASGRRNSKVPYGRKSSRAINDIETANLEMEAMEMGISGSTMTASEGNLETGSDTSLAEQKVMKGIRVDRTVSIKMTDDSHLMHC